MTISRHDHEMAGGLAGIARVLGGRRAPEQVVASVVDAAVGCVPGCGHAGIMTVGPDGRVRTVSSSDEIPDRVDAIQYDVGAGPGLEVLCSDETRRVDDLGIDGRWAEFSRRAVDEVGVRSMLALALSGDEGRGGVLTLYSCAPQAFDSDSEAVGAVLAAHASVALSGHRYRERAANLAIALRNSRSIGIGVGIVMVTRRVGEQEAFELLRASSQRLNVKLRDVASMVIQCGALDEDAIRRLSY